ncbi:MAG: nucleotide exchange factor GrpE [Planctomycetota bacterium]
MSGEECKIEIASSEEVARYAPGGPAREAEPSAVGPVPESAEAQTPSDESSEDELTALRQQVAELQDKFLRAKAEAQNVARRAQQEQTETVLHGNAELLRALLPVVDDFERTLAAAADPGHAQPVVEGIKLIYDKLMKLLKNHAVEAFEAVGQPFDPTRHAAILEQPSDRHAPGTVMQEVERGYRYRDRILRPARVIVAKAAQGPSDEGGVPV